VKREVDTEEKSGMGWLKQGWREGNSFPNSLGKNHSTRREKIKKTNPFKKGESLKVRKTTARGGFVSRKKSRAKPTRKVKLNRRE